MNVIESATFSLWSLIGIFLSTHLAAIGTVLTNGGTEEMFIRCSGIHGMLQQKKNSFQ